MKLISAKVGPFRSINIAQTVAIDPEVTVLVGMNEAGKTVFLKALQKSNDWNNIEQFDPLEDYPKRSFTAYMKKHATNPDVVTRLTYQPSESLLAEINAELCTDLPTGFQFSVIHNYANEIFIELDVNEHSVIEALAQTEGLSKNTAELIKESRTIREVIVRLSDGVTSEPDRNFLEEIKARSENTQWESIVQYEVWSRLEKHIPKFRYFSDYNLLPGKINLRDLSSRVSSTDTDFESNLQEQDLTVLALLRMADIDLPEILGNVNHDVMEAKIESVSIRLTDKILDFWKQNEGLEIEVDIKSDPTDETPYNNGPNLYLRIKNRRHRGVSTNFSKRSKGFIWFFSFLVWFDSLRHQIESSETNSFQNSILLLDEPSLSLHSLAQADFLKYIEKLSEHHQIVYTTHSPFMLQPEKLSRVRAVEDQEKIGTIITDHFESLDPQTVFPLKAALGYEILNSFSFARKTLLVEDPSELIYIKSISAILNAHYKNGLHDDVNIVPVGNLCNIAAFNSLIGINNTGSLNVGLLYKGSRDGESRECVLKNGLMQHDGLFNISQFRTISKSHEELCPADLEDLLSPGLYLHYFNTTFSKQLDGNVLTESDLHEGERMIQSIERILNERNLKLSPVGGFSRYAVAVSFAQTPPRELDSQTTEKFEMLFRSMNHYFSS